MREYEPHRLAWHALAVLFGLLALAVPPAGLAALVRPWLLWLWAMALLASGAAGLAVPFQRPALGLATERAALWIQTGTLVWVIISSLYLRGTAGLVGMLLYIIWIAANVARDRRIASVLTKSRPPARR
jgi:hypothetical protein